jgi:hypothetical protein
MEGSGVVYLQAFLTSPPPPLPPGAYSTDTNQKRGWLGSRAGLDVLQEDKSVNLSEIKSSPAVV